MKQVYEVMEYRSSADTYEVEASSEKEAEDLVGEGKGKLILNWQEHDFYETSVKDEMIDMSQQAEVYQVNGETQLGIVGSNGTQMIIRRMTEEEKEVK